ncbi:MAG TPA: chromate resistance protein ChrB domain-containing protein [Candidatus Eremiobacteraceae bacterium]|nr:chromate resistance protein ChrB domain-containing protein [Candidatus Eremiobacteraceae bacterium]
MKKNRWLMLVHQIPRTPSYLRVKIWRRLQRIGALPIKNSVYAMPAGEQAFEDLAWVAREIEQGGGEASICEASFVHGLRDDQVEAAFKALRDSDYRVIAAEARRVASARPSKTDDAGASMADEIERLKRRLADTTAIDFFKTGARAEAAKAVAALDRGPDEGKRRHTPTMRDLKGKTWVTRRDVFVDRMASAWLIRRFIDRSARFKFVPGKRYEARKGEMRFDMFGGEFTHEGDRCTFEVLVERAGLDDPGLTAIGQIVHDIDLKDSKFERPEKAGIERVLEGIVLAHADDKTRLDRSAPIFDDLHSLMGKRRRR